MTSLLVLVTAFVMHMFLMCPYCSSWARRFVSVVGSRRTRYRPLAITLYWWSESSGLLVGATLPWFGDSGELLACFGAGQEMLLWFC